MIMIKQKATTKQMTSEQSNNDVQVPLKVYLWDRGSLPESVYTLSVEDQQRPLREIQQRVERSSYGMNFIFCLSLSNNQLNKDCSYQDLSPMEQAHLYIQVIQD